ncbi:hypothetical protein ACH5RR_008116 [Cinchona calisaya]|uniref:Uncharacterized protein n=1 Tax=Cinchona calisaya TaxID=153742 RepID=A0ABD3AAP4_9GENT
MNNGVPGLLEEYYKASQDYDFFQGVAEEARRNFADESPGIMDIVGLVPHRNLSYRPVHDVVALYTYYYMVKWHRNLIACSCGSRPEHEQIRDFCYRKFDMMIGVDDLFVMYYDENSRRVMGDFIPSSGYEVFNYHVYHRKRAASKKAVANQPEAAVANQPEADANH